MKKIVGPLLYHTHARSHYMTRRRALAGSISVGRVLLPPSQARCRHFDHRRFSFLSAVGRKAMIRRPCTISPRARIIISRDFREAARSSRADFCFYEAFSHAAVFPPHWRRHHCFRSRPRAALIGHGAGRPVTCTLASHAIALMATGIFVLMPLGRHVDADTRHASKPATIE